MLWTRPKRHRPSRTRVELWRGSRTSRPSARLLRVEALEYRLLRATVTWDGGAGGTDWTDALNWDTDTLPGAADDVVIPDLGTLGAVDQTITFGSGSAAIRSL